MSATTDPNSFVRWRLRLRSKLTCCPYWTTRGPTRVRRSTPMSWPGVIPAFARTPPSRRTSVRRLSLTSPGWPAFAGHDKLCVEARNSSFGEQIERQAPNAPGKRGDRQAPDDGGPIFMPDVEQHARERKHHDQGRADA